MTGLGSRLFPGDQRWSGTSERTYQESLGRVEVLIGVSAASAAWVSRLRTHGQKMMVAAIAIALMKAWAQRSYLVAIRRQSLSLPNMRAMRCL